MAVWSSARRYRGEGDVGAWIWGIAIRRLISKLRGHREPAPASAEVIAHASPLVQSAEDELLVAVEHGDVGSALHRLSPGAARRRPGHRPRRSHHQGGRATARAPPRHGQEPDARCQGAAARRAAGRERERVMTQDTSWHAGRELLGRYSDGTLGRAGQAAVETHLTGCAECRAEAHRLAAGPGARARVGRRHGRDLRAPAAAGRSGCSTRPRRAGTPTSSCSAPRARSPSRGHSRSPPPWSSSWSRGRLSMYEQQVFYAVMAPLLPAAPRDRSPTTRPTPPASCSPSTPFSKLRVALLRTVLAVVAALPVVVLMGALVPGLERTAWRPGSSRHSPWPWWPWCC